MLPDNLRVLYLHGFASSPQSRKAQFFAGHLPSLGFKVEIPDLARGDFEHLTITDQLELIEKLAKSQPCILVGSSLGGYLASLYASRHPEVDRLILLAPAFNLHALWVAELGPDRLREWQQRGALPFYHYGEGRQKLLGFQFLEDSGRYPAFPNFQQPALLIHGNQDAVVPVVQSVQFARKHDNVQLVQLDAGHELTEVLDEIWEGSRNFLSPVSRV